MTKRYRLRVEEEYPQALETKWNNLLQKEPFKDNKEFVKLSQILLQRILQSIEIVPNTHYVERENVKEVNKPVDPQLEKRVDDLTKKLIGISEKVFNQRTNTPKLIQEQNEKIKAIQSDEKPLEFSAKDIKTENEEEEMKAIDNEVQKTIREIENTVNEVHSSVQILCESLPESIKKAKRVKDALSIDIFDLQNS